MAPNNKSSILALFALWMATWFILDNGIDLVSAQDDDDNPKEFNIQLHYLNDVDVEIQEVFDSAKERWERVLVHSDIDTRYVVPRFQRICGFFAPEREEIDDLLIYVKVAAIDGPGKILGQAGPCAVDREGRVRVGYLELDLADILSEIKIGRANCTILHEIGHILGIGTCVDDSNAFYQNLKTNRFKTFTKHRYRLWESYDLIGESEDHELEDYEIRYLGNQGNIGNKEVGMKYEAVVEDSGGEGTFRSKFCCLVAIISFLKRD